MSQYGSQNPWQQQLQQQQLQQWQQQQLQQQQYQQALLSKGSNSFPTKIYLPDEEIRRVMLPREIKYEALLQLLLPYVNLDRKSKLNVDSLRVYYMDEEKEYVRFDSAQEWTYVLEKADNPFLKLRVKLLKEKKAKKIVNEAPKVESAESDDEPLPVVSVPTKLPTNITPPSKPVTLQPTTAQQEPQDLIRQANESMRASFHSLLSQQPNKPQQPFTIPPQTIPDFPVPKFGTTNPVSPFQPNAYSSQQPVQPQIPSPQQPVLFKEVVPEKPKSSPITTQPTNNYEPLLRELNDMGFTNREKNIELLAKHNGHLLNVINALMEQ